MNAVCSDYDIRRDRRPVTEPDGDGIGILADVRAPVPGAHRARRQLLREEREEIGPVDAHVPPGLRELVRFMPRGLPVGEP
jgi:hypothetical protein